MRIQERGELSDRFTMRSGTKDLFVRRYHQHRKFQIVDELGKYKDSGRKLSENAPWQKCQVKNRCPYRKSRSVTASVAASCSIDGPRIISYWSIMSANPNCSNDEHRGNQFITRFGHALLSAAKENSDRKLDEVESLDCSKATAKKASCTLDLKATKEHGTRSSRSRNSRRRDKYLAYKVSRRFWKRRKCPDPPHNTTSFLMDYHEDDDIHLGEQYRDENYFPFRINYQDNILSKSGEEDMSSEEKSDDDRDKPMSRSWTDYLIDEWECVEQR